MPSISREGSQDREMVLRHQRSYGSESGRLSVPMWDSSDPERAPPPLPLNPIGQNASPTKPNTSATVAAAAQMLAERARESMGPSPYVVNDFPGRSRSPEKSPTKGPQHKRLQSLQTRSTKELKANFENNFQSQKESSRPTTPSGPGRDVFFSSPERLSSRAATPTPNANSFRRGSTVARSASPSNRRPLASENTPPSDSMIAIKSTETTPLADISNFSVPRSTFPNETLQEQIQNLTTIAASLQKEMSALSRRSKDNASDLLSLKEATNTRDKDIRDSLKELITTGRPEGSRSTSAMGLHNPLLDGKPFNAAPITKSISLPRIPSMHFDTMGEQDRPGSPSLCSVDGTASLAMLEKIIREMVTKDGQERLLSNLSELLNKSSNTSTETAKKVEELVEFIKEKSTSQALIKSIPEASNQARQLDPKSGALARTSFRSSSTDEGSNILSDDLVKMLQRIKDSVIHSGGLTGEVKLLVRELRGEVLGMGRELGRKLDAVEPSTKEDGNNEEPVSREELARIVQEGLSELKEQMDQVIQARRRQSSSSAVSRSPVDNNEVYAVVKHALSERGLDETNQQNPPLDQQAILTAVREAYEAYKPEIELQQFGLERDEILQCLKEGLEDYQANKDSSNLNGISRDEVLSAVQEGLQYFNPPAPVTEASEIKEEILMTVRECLESFRASISEDVERGRSTVTREDVSDAVRAELGTFKHEGAREVEINSQDLYNAVKAGLETMDRPLGEYGDQVLTSLHTIIDGMRNEFKEYSAANGRDTEQVLDALKDGLERLRAEVESYVDRAQDVTGKDEIIDTLKSGLESIRASFDLQMDQSSRSGDSVLERDEVANFLKAEFGTLHEALATQKNAIGLDSETREDIVNAITEGLIAIKHDIGGGSSESLSPEVGEAIKEEIENLRTAILAGTSMHKDELLDTLHDSIGAIHSKLDMQSSNGASTTLPSDEIIAIIREEFEVLRDSMGSQTTRDIDGDDRGNFVDAIKESMDAFKAQIASNQTENIQESLGFIKEELELLRSSLGGNLLPEVSSVTGKNEIIDAIREGLAELHETQFSRGTSELSSESTLEILREELENLRESIASTVTRSGPQHDSVEIIDTIRLGLDDLRSDIERRLDNPERFASSKTEILESLNDGLDGLRADISNIGNKPVDMTVSYEILETLKTGLADLRTDFGKLSSSGVDSRDTKSTSGNEIVLAESSNGQVDRNVDTEGDSAPALKKDDLEKMEVMLTHLQIKVEAMDQNIQSPPSAESNPVHSEADLQAIETALRELQSTVTELANREIEVRQAEGSATKDDVDAIETLLQNTKAKVEETLDAAVTRDQIEAVEASLKMTGESVDTLSARVDENLATKVDITSLELLLQGATTSLNEMKELVSTDKDKAEFEFVEGLCVEIKDRVAELPTAESVPSKEEIDQISELIKDFKTSHEAFKERYETDIGITAKAFDDRKEESKEVRDMICALKDFMEESSETLKSRIKRGSADVRALDEILESIEEKIEEVPKTSSEIHELLLAFKDEFEKAHDHLENIKGTQEENSTATLAKQEEMKDKMVTELAEKLEDRFAEFMTRQDDHYLLAEQTQKELAEKVSQQEDLLSNHKAMAEDLKLTIDTLGASITGITPALAEATEKMDNDSLTVFGKIDDVHSKLDSHFYDFKTEHDHTRGEVAKSLAAVTNVHQEVTNFNPKAMDLLSNLLKIAGDHFEHSKKSQEASVNNAEKAREEFDQIKSSFAALPIPRIEAPPVEPPKYDDSGLQSKLDQLLSQSTSEAQKPSLGLEKLDEMHQQIMDAASQLSGLIAAQRKAITDEHDFKASEAKEAAESLAKCVAEKELLESTVINLRETKESLVDDVKNLKVEQEGLSTKKTRLSAELSSLETALSIRREELQMMDARAEALERRIMERVMDHSRALLIAKAPKSTVTMNLKRVTSNVSQSTASTTTPTSVISASTNMALKARPADRKSVRPTDPNARRILSLSQITNNVPTGAKAISPTPRNVTSGLNNLKRSQSVKNAAVRKASWAGRGSLAASDKENSVLEEMDHENDDDASHDPESVSNRSASYTGTEMSGMNRRPSYGTGASEYSYETGSYITGTDIDRRSSCGSTIRSNLNGAGSALEDSIYEEDEDEYYEDEQISRDNESHEQNDTRKQKEDDEELVQQAVPLVAEALKKYVEEHGIPRGYDSGLGSDLPTAEFCSTIMGSEISEQGEN